MKTVATAYVGALAAVRLRRRSATLGFKMQIGAEMSAKL